MHPTSSTPVIARPLPLVPAADTPSGTLPLALRWHWQPGRAAAIGAASGAGQGTACCACRVAARPRARSCLGIEDLPWRWPRPRRPRQQRWRRRACRRGRIPSLCRCHAGQSTGAPAPWGRRRGGCGAHLSVPGARRAACNACRARCTREQAAHVLASPLRRSYPGPAACEGDVRGQRATPSAGSPFV